MNEEKQASPEPQSFEELVNEEEERERIEAVMQKTVRRRGASKPQGAFARSDWFWIWSKGSDLLDALGDSQQPKPEDSPGASRDEFALDLAKARLGSEVDDVCEAAGWNISEYRKIYGITVAELAKAIDVSETTFRKKLGDGTLTLKEFLTVCSVCLTDPCVMLGFVEDEDVGLVHSLHMLAKASDHRAVGELAHMLMSKQGGFRMIRKSVSPIADDSPGQNVNTKKPTGKSEPDWDEIRRELLPTWPLWWETGFDYTEFNELIDEYLMRVGRGRREDVTYEMKARAASKIINLMRDDPSLLYEYRRYRALREKSSKIELNGNTVQVDALDKLTRRLYTDFANHLLKANGDKKPNEEG